MSDIVTKNLFTEQEFEGITQRDRLMINYKMDLMKKDWASISVFSKDDKIIFSDGISKTTFDNIDPSKDALGININDTDYRCYLYIDEDIDCTCLEIFKSNNNNYFIRKIIHDLNYIINESEL